MPNRPLNALGPFSTILALTLLFGCEQPMAPEPFEPLFNPFEGGRASLGRFCGPSGLETRVILTTEPLGCAEHAEILANGYTRDGLWITLPDGVPAGALETEAEVCREFRCRTRPIRLEIDTPPPNLTGRWRVALDEDVATGALTPSACDYLDHLPRDTTDLENSLTIREVAIYQGVKRPLTGEDVPFAPDVPLISGREALLRVFYRPRRALLGRTLTGRLTWTADGQTQTFTATATALGVSTELGLPSTMNFKVPASAMTSRVDWSMEIRLAETCPPPERPTPPVRIPASGTLALESRPVGTLNVTLVPFRYLPDGSDRLPDLSDEQLRAYRNALLGMLPVEDVALTVREPVDWARHINGSVGSWSALLAELYAVRARDNPPDSTYYYGLVQPTEAYRNYRGRVAGVASLPAPADVANRGGVGLGHGVPFTTNILVHELGHAMGRRHAPCGDVEGVDPEFPVGNLGASIGSWGYDSTVGGMRNPRSYKDFMSYCQPVWVSDYTFGKLAERLAFVLSGARLLGSEKRQARFLSQPPEGPRWSEAVEVVVPSGAPVPVAYFAEGELIDEGTGTVLPLDHGSALTVVPEAPAGTTHVRVDGAWVPWPKTE